MHAGKGLLDYTNLFSPSDYKKNDKILYKYLKGNYVRRSQAQVYTKKNWWNKKNKTQSVKSI